MIIGSKTKAITFCNSFIHLNPIFYGFKRQKMSCSFRTKFCNLSHSAIRISFEQIRDKCKVVEGAAEKFTCFSQQCWQACPELL